MDRCMCRVGWRAIGRKTVGHVCLRLAAAAALECGARVDGWWRGAAYLEHLRFRDREHREEPPRARASQSYCQQPTLTVML